MDHFPVSSNSSQSDATHRRLATAVLLLCSGLSTSDLCAQIMDYGSLEALFGEPVTTSVTGSPQRAGDVPATMVIISAEQIRRSGAIDIPGVLQHVTGLDVLRWTSNGADVGVRGYNKVFSPRLLVLINGRQVYADFYGLTAWSSLPVELGEIRQIEVIKGPNSALFGFNAVGGVINIITFNPHNDDVSFAEITVGTQAHRQFSGATTFGLGERGGMRITAGLRENDDFETPIGKLNEGARIGDTREAIRFDFHYDLQPGVTAEVEASYTDIVQTNMTPPYTLGVHEDTSASIKGHLSADSKLGLTLAAVYTNRIDNKGFISAFDGAGYSVGSTPYLHFRNNMWVAQLQHIFKPGNDHTVRLSGEYRNSSVNTTPVEGGEVEYDVLAGGVMWNWQLAPAWALTSAARYDSLDLGRSGSFPAGLALSNSEWDRNIGEASFNAGLVWNMSALDTFRLTTARGAQLPSLYNLGASQYEFPGVPGTWPPTIFITGSPNLKPTIVSNHELAWDRKLQAIDGEMRLAYFVGDSDDILSDWGGSDFARTIFSQPANIGSSRTDGLELSAKGNFLDEWHWSLGYINQDIDDDFGQLTTGQAFSNFEDVTPQHIGNAGLGWTRAAWEVDAFVQYQSTHWGLRADPEQIPGDSQANPDLLVAIPDYVTANARVGYQWSEKIRLAISAQNLFTDEQQQTSGPKVERRIMGTLRLKF